MTERDTIRPKSLDQPALHVDFLVNSQSSSMQKQKMFLPHPRVKVSIVGSLRDREVACSASDRQGSNFESCVWRTVSSQSSHHPQEVLLAQLSLYVYKGGLKPDSFHLFPCNFASNISKNYDSYSKNVVPFMWVIQKFRLKLTDSLFIEERHILTTYYKLSNFLFLMVSIIFFLEFFRVVAIRLENNACKILWKSDDNCQRN